MQAPAESAELREYLQAIDLEIRTVIQSVRSGPAAGLSGAGLGAMLSYHLGWTDALGHPAAADPGKRLRPLICLWSCAAVGGDWKNALPAAAAIELVHNFSLIHDDIEDNSAERRGRAAVWKVWGVAQALNSGDAMFALARLALDRLDGRVSPEAFADTHEAFDAATLALTQGQFLDLSFEQALDVTVDDYMEMVRGKTAALIAAAAEIGARVGTEAPRMVEALARYGENLGIAFQIADDILGIWGDPEVTGKPAGGDILARKKSLPILLALKSENGAEIAGWLNQPASEIPPVRQVTDLLNRAHAREATQALADEYVRRALSALDGTKLSNPAITRLRGLAQGAARREK